MSALLLESTPEAEVVLVLPHVCFWRIGRTFWSVFSHSHRSVSATAAGTAGTGSHESLRARAQQCSLQNEIQKQRGVNAHVAPLRLCHALHMSQAMSGCSLPWQATSDVLRRFGRSLPGTRARSTSRGQSLARAVTAGALHLP